MKIRSISHYVSQSLYGLSIMLTAVRWRAEAILIDSGATHWALLALLKLARMRIVGVLHETSRPSGYKPTRRLRRIFSRVGRMVLAAAQSTLRESELNHRLLDREACRPLTVKN
jgi:hypothetical protein